MKRSYFDCPVSALSAYSDQEILGYLAQSHGHSLDLLQRDSWVKQIRQLRDALTGLTGGHVFLEFAIPRMGKRADVVLYAGSRIIVVEYKVGAVHHDKSAVDQVVDYSLDLKNFHEASHDLEIVPVLVSTEAPESEFELIWHSDGVAQAIVANRNQLGATLTILAADAAYDENGIEWMQSRYKPTPTIVQAAKALYEGHRVDDISRSDSGAINLSRTSAAISRVIEQSKREGQKSICFVTGVPGSGKTLAGLNIATDRMRADEDEHAVFLSGNGPLVSVLREALTRDEVLRAKESGLSITKKQAAQKSHAFIQNIHHFRDECLSSESAPIEKVVIFDEAQRAWDQRKTSSFMSERRGVKEFLLSEPEFLISAMDRHEDWCVVVCLIGNGQEINAGEAGISEWFNALERRFPHWRSFYSPRYEEEAFVRTENFGPSHKSEIEPDLHLGVSVRSFRAEKQAEFVSAVLDGRGATAFQLSRELVNYPLAVTRDLEEARNWLREQARGSERFGLVASSNALRLKHAGLNMKAKIDAPLWFLNASEDVRSSLSLEDAASEFEVQGLELDWSGVCWDANLRWTGQEWTLHRFSGTKWQSVNDSRRRQYLINSYRVLLTRARQGMVVFVPKGSTIDSTRVPAYYDATFDFLLECGFSHITRTSSA